MPSLIGNALVLAVLVTVAVLAARSLYKSHRSRGTCNGDCASCARCGSRHCK